MLVLLGGATIVVVSRLGVNSGICSQVPINTTEEMYCNFGYLHAKLGMKTNVHTTGTAPWYSAVADWDFVSDLCIQQEQIEAAFSEI